MSDSRSSGFALVLVHLYFYLPSEFKAVSWLFIGSQNGISLCHDVR